MTQKLHEVLAGHHDVLINDEVAATAAELLKSRPASVPEPGICPLVGGGLELYWEHVNGWDASITIYSFGSGFAYWTFEARMAMDGSVDTVEATWLRKEEFPMCHDAWDRIASIFGEVAPKVADLTIDGEGRVTGDGFALLLAAESIAGHSLTRNEHLEIIRDGGFIVNGQDADILADSPCGARRRSESRC